MTHQHKALEDTVYFWFAANNTSGSGGDGATPLFDVREAGAAAGAIPLLSGTPTLLTHANYPDGCYEVAVAATTANGFAAGDTFAVFCTLAIDSQNPSGFVGSCTLDPIRANVIEWNDVALATTNPLPNVAAGAVGGVPLSFDASGRVELDATQPATTFASLTVTNDLLISGALDIDDGIDVSCSTADRRGINVVSNGNGEAVRFFTTGNGDALLCETSGGIASYAIHAKALGGTSQIGIRVDSAGIGANIVGSTQGVRVEGDFDCDNDFNVAGALAVTSNVNLASNLNITGQLNIDDGIDVSCSTANRDALKLVGNGAGDGVDIVPGATGKGIRLLGGATSGEALFMEAAAASDTIRINNTGTGDGVHIAVVGSAADALYCNASGVNGIGLHADGGVSGAGVDLGDVSINLLQVLTTTDLIGAVSMQDGLAITCTSPNKTALAATGSGTGAGIKATGGSAGFHGVANAAAGDGMLLQGNTTGAGINAVGGATGPGINGGSAGSGAGYTGDWTGDMTGNITGTLSTVTAVTNNVNAAVVSMGANTINAASIVASALDGKGNWNIGKTGYSISGTITTLDGLNNLSEAQVNAQCDAAIETYRLNELFNVALTAQPAVGSFLGDLTEDNAGTQRFTAAALALAPDTTNVTVTAMNAGVIDAASIAANAIEAGKINAGALNGKGDWNTVVPDVAGTAATPANVLTQVNTALDTAIAELGVGIPTATPNIREALILPYMALRNKLDVTTSGADEMEIHNDAGTIIAKKAITDVGGDYSEAKMVSG